MIVDNDGVRIMTVIITIAWISLGVGLAAGFAMGRWTADELSTD